MRPFQARSGSRVRSLPRSRTRRFFRLALQRRIVCSAIAFNLLLWPGPGVVAEPFISLASQVINTRVAFYSNEAFFLRRLFSQATSRPRRETMADRAAAVARIQINPLKFVHYNSRVWSRRNNQVAFDAITGSPSPGYPLGFGRIVFYDVGSGGNPTGKFMWVENDGTRHYLGTGTYMGSGYASGGPYETRRGSTKYDLHN